MIDFVDVKEAHTQVSGRAFVDAMQVFMQGESQRHLDRTATVTGQVDRQATMATRVNYFSFVRDIACWTVKSYGTNLAQTTDLWLKGFYVKPKPSNSSSAAEFLWHL